MSTEWKSILPHSRHFKDGLLGSGLAIFSRFPIVAAHLSIFPTNGAPWRFTHGDWYSGKGIAMVAVRLESSIDSEPSKHLAIFNLHVHAEYGPKRESMLGTRLVQLWQARHMIDAVACNYNSVIVCGDFNTKPDELPFVAYFKEDLGVSKHFCDPGAVKGEPTEGINEYKRGRRPKRIDYILTHNAECTEYTVENVKIDESSLSDHSLLTAHLDINSQECGPCQKRDHIVSQEIASTQSQIRAILQVDLDKRRRQSTVFFTIWAILIAASLGFGAYSIVTVYIPNYPRTISLMLYIFFPIVVIVSDYFFFLWLFARADAKVFERVINEV